MNWTTLLASYTPPGQIFNELYIISQKCLFMNGHCCTIHNRKKLEESSYPSFCAMVYRIMQWDISWKSRMSIHQKSAFWETCSDSRPWKYWLLNSGCSCCKFHWSYCTPALYCVSSPKLQQCINQLLDKIFLCTGTLVDFFYTMGL